MAKFSIQPGYRKPACQGKLPYMTERLAQVAADMMESHYRERFAAYTCGDHWHVGHRQVYRERTKSAS